MGSSRANLELLSSKVNIDAQSFDCAEWVVDAHAFFGLNNPPEELEVADCIADVPGEDVCLFVPKRRIIDVLEYTHPQGCSPVLDYGFHHKGEDAGGGSEAEG